MGRYYQGDIEGKFWFGVQASDDGEFFGARAIEPMSIDYQVEDIKEVEEGLKKCKMALGINKKRLDEFFDSLEFGYNEEMLINWYKDKLKLTMSSENIKNLLEWYARLDLGEKIHKVWKCLICS